MPRKDYEKKSINVYLPKHLENKVREYGFSYGMARDTPQGKEPRWGSAILHILEKFFEQQGTGTVSSPENLEQLRKEVESVKYQLIHLDQRLSTPSETPLEPSKDGDEDVSP